MTDNRTTELREKLREHDIEYKPTKFSTLQTTFTANGIEWIVTEREATGELFVEPRHGLTPEQAIAATLGSGTCEIEQSFTEPSRLDFMQEYLCSVCGEYGYMQIATDDDCLHYCPNCGARVVTSVVAI